MDKMQKRDGGRAGSVERPDTEVPWGPQPLPAMGVIMTRLLCVTVVVILAAGVLMEAIFHSSFFFHVWLPLERERKSILCQHCRWRDNGRPGTRYKQTSVFIESSPVFPREAAWEMGERETRLSKP